MSELKTLKDINHINNYDEDEYCNEIINKHFDETVLKQEAIKWIKDCENPIDFTRNDSCGEALDKFPNNYCFVCRRFIKFFNITEEDLNEEFCACGNSKDSDEEVCKECK